MHISARELITSYQKTGRQGEEKYVLRVRMWKPLMSNQDLVILLNLHEGMHEFAWIQNIWILSSKIQICLLNLCKATSTQRHQKCALAYMWEGSRGTPGEVREPLLRVGLPAVVSACQLSVCVCELYEGVSDLVCDWLSNKQHVWLSWW